MALAIKAMPVPDFGIDEILLLVIVLVLVTFYRATLRQILPPRLGDVAGPASGAR